VSQNKNRPEWGGFWRYIKFFQKVLDLFFLLWHKDKVNGRNAPGPKPARPCALRVFAFWGGIKEVIRMQRQGLRQGGGALRRMLIGGWRSHYGGILRRF